MPKTLKVTLEIEVDDLPPDEDEAGVTQEMVDLKEATAAEAASPLESINEFTSAELFGGTAIALQYNNCRVIEAAWK